MKAEHRHELKTNELAEWLSNFPVWVKKNYRIIIYASLVIVLVAATYFYKRYQKTIVADRERSSMSILLSQLTPQKTSIAQEQARGNDTSYTLLQMADEFENIANTTGTDAVAALSLIKEGEILRTELQFRLGNITPEDITNQINRAREKYNKALDTYLQKTPNRPLEALARFGLGLCAEELGNVEEARNIYNQIVANPDFEPTTIFQTVKNRLAMMDSYNTKLVLPPAPASNEPPQPSAIQPAIQPQMQITPGVNLPGLAP